MKHIVAISFVFFSLTHLAKAEQRIEGLRLLTEYCNKQQSNTQTITVGTNQQNDEQSPFFLSYSELALIGLHPQLQNAQYGITDQSVSDLMVVEKPKNNSP